jgi:hypothetical protein
MRQCIQDVALPVFELFSDRAEALEYLAEHGSRSGGAFGGESLTLLAVGIGSIGWLTSGAHLLIK